MLEKKEADASCSAARPDAAAMGEAGVQRAIPVEMADDAKRR